MSEALKRSMGQEATRRYRESATDPIASREVLQIGLLHAADEIERLSLALTRAMDRGNELERQVEMARDPERWDEFLESVGSPPVPEAPTPLVEVYRNALAEIETLAFRQYVDWMHFHELAMAKPFDAESEAQEFAQTVSSWATIALGAYSTIEVHEPSASSLDSEQE